MTRTPAIASAMLATLVGLHGVRPAHVGAQDTGEPVKADALLWNVRESRTLCHRGPTLERCEASAALLAQHARIEQRVARIAAVHTAGHRARAVAAYEAMLTELQSGALHLTRSAELILKRLGALHIVSGALRRAEYAWSRLSRYTSTELQMHVLVPFAAQLSWEYHKVGQHRRAASLWQWPVLLMLRDGDENLIALADRHGIRPFQIPLATQAQFVKNSPAHRLGLFTLALNAGWHALEGGAYDLAASHFARAHSLSKTLREPALGEVVVANAMGALYARRGDPERARAIWHQALRSLTASRGADSPYALPLRAQLFSLAQRDQRPPAAEAIRQWRERAPGASGEKNAIRMNALLSAGDIILRWGDDESAEALYRHALTWYEHDRAGDPLAAAEVAQNIGLIHQRRGQWTLADSFLTQALVHRRQRLPDDHLAIAETLGHLAVIRGQRGHVARAISAWREASTIMERARREPLAPIERAHFASPELKRLDRLDENVSFQLRFAGDSSPAATFVMNQLIRDKGRSIDALINQYRWLRTRSKGPQRRLFLRLEALRKQLSSAVYNNAAKTQLTRIERDIADTVQRLRHHLPSADDSGRAVSLESIVETLPERSALVEYVVYRPGANASTSQPAPLRYAAYVTDHRGRVASFDLGVAATINKAVFTLRTALSTPGHRHVRALARALDAIVLQPVRTHVGAIDTLYVAPDGALAIIPMQALVTESGRYTLEDWLLVYVNSARDLLRVPARRAGVGAVILADPRFDEPATGNPATRPTKPTARAMHFSALRAAATEARDIAELFAARGLDARTLLGSAARETALEAVRSPRILHIATHGFFLNGGAADARDRRAVIITEERPGQRTGPIAVAPLLRSGLALTGANRGGPDASTDGIMTAMEASTLRLDGTRLVVLSACDTGLGALTVGDGVYGLQRALSIAGAETIVASLWRVSDSATKDLMVGYYRELLAGHGRAESLRRVQLSFLRERTRAHPFYWAPFVVTGDPRPLRAATEKSWFTGKARTATRKPWGDGLALRGRLGPTIQAPISILRGPAQEQSSAAAIGGALAWRRGSHDLGVSAEATLVGARRKPVREVYLGVYAGRSVTLEFAPRVHPVFELELGAHWFARLTSDTGIYREATALTPYAGVRTGFFIDVGRAWSLGFWLTGRYDLRSVTQSNISSDLGVETIRLGGLHLGGQLALRYRL